MLQSSVDLHGVFTPPYLLELFSMQIMLVADASGRAGHANRFGEHLVSSLTFSDPVL